MFSRSSNPLFIMLPMLICLDFRGPTFKLCSQLSHDQQSIQPGEDGLDKQSDHPFQEFFILLTTDIAIIFF